MNTENNNLGSELAYNALDEVPQPKADAKEITGLLKSGSKITGYQQYVGKEYSLPTALLCILFRFLFV